jgi:hypothetical protein
MPGSPSSAIDPIDNLQTMAAGGRLGNPGKPLFCGDIDIRIGRDGTWFYHGSPICRKPLVKLFASVLRRELDGEYWLMTPVERGRIKVDEVPFTAVEVDASGSCKTRVLTFRTNIDEYVTADADHPIRVTHDSQTGAPRPYVLVRERLEARILRPVFYELVEMSQVGRVGDNEVHGVWSREQFFPLGPCDPA